MRKALLTVFLGGLLMVGAAGQGVGFGIGGPMLGLITLDLAGLNASLTGAGYPALPEQLLVFGGGGLAGVTGGTALGGFGISGSTDAMVGPRSASLQFSFGGFQLERVERLAPRALLGFGGVIGGGDLELTVRARYADDFEDAITDPTTVHLQRAFFGAMVHVRLQLQLLDVLGLEGWAGYMAGLPGRWQDRDREIAGGEVDVIAPFFGVRLAFGGIGEIEPPRVPDVRPEPEPEPEIEPEPEPENDETIEDEQDN